VRTICYALEISDERLTLIKDELIKIDNHIENGELVDAEQKLNALKIDKADIAFVLAKRKIQIKKLSIIH
jgi:hypothetical protein